MDLQFPEKILNEAKECSKNYSCLSNQENGRCTVNFSMEGIPFVMIKKPSDDQCPYYFDFGDSHFCNCPVRFELYRRYGI